MSPTLACPQARGLPSDDGRTVDTLAGGLLRLFSRLGEVEAALAKVTNRVAVLEKGPGVAKAARKTAAASRRAP
jgi:hypothetical protein